MSVLICFAGLFVIIIASIYVVLDFMRMKTLQRIKLLESYSKLYFALKINYKYHNKFTLFCDKSDFLCFHVAFKCIYTYIKGLKKWSDLSDWNLGMLIEAPIIATEKYSYSNVARFIDDNLLFIAQRSIVLMFPVRVYTAMHFNNKDNKFMIGDIDLTVIKEELINSSKILKNSSEIHAINPPSYNKRMPFKYSYIFKERRKRNYFRLFMENTATKSFE